MKRIRNKIALLAIYLLLTHNLFAQVPQLPPTNLGLANVFDGVAGKPGFLYQGYAQAFQAQSVRNDHGANIHSPLKVNSILEMNQLIWLTPVKTLGGNLGFTLLIPLVQIAASNGSATAPSVNPGIIGDVIQGTAIQWSDKKIFGKALSHRVELDINLPIGSYSDAYAINASSHAWAVGIYHAFTLMLNDKISISSRNQLNYNARFIGEPAKAGAYYNGNYSVDLAILPKLRIEAAAYYLTQLTQDTYNGNSHYYQEQLGISTTREHVLGYGPGLAYFTKSGVLLELKTFFETAAQNRMQGSRPTLRMAIPLH